jgi:hypothetical protein
MAAEAVVDPAMANWRSPIWPTKHTPNNPARDRTDRTGNHKARTRSSSGTDHVGACGSRDRCDCRDDRDCEHKVAHLISPPEEIRLRQLNAQSMTPGASGKPDRCSTAIKPYATTPAASRYSSNPSRLILAE